jgi:hypothetical protein
MELELTAANCLWPPDAFAENAGRRRTPSIPSCQPADSAHALLAENQISYLSSVASDMMLRRRCRNRTFHGVFGTVVVQRQEREWGPSENGTSVGGRYAGGSLQGAGASLTFGKGFNSLHLIESIMEFIKHRNDAGKPFVWTAKAEDILAKIERCRQRLEEIAPGCTSIKKRKSKAAA